MAEPIKVNHVERLKISSDASSEHCMERKDEINGDSIHKSEDCCRVEAEKIAWSTALKSPSSASFSPSKDFVVGTNEPQHGRALLALAERGHIVTSLYRRATVLLLEVARAYDDFSQSLLKAGQSLKEVGTDASDLQQSLVFWSGSTSKLANSFRTEICTPLKSLLQAYTDSLQGIREKYLNSRQTCVLVRQSTERVASSYNQALQVAEKASLEWTTNGKSEGTMYVSLKSFCKDLQQQKSRYRKFVDWEKTCNDQCGDMEKIALEALQLLEDHRMHFTTSVLALGVQSLRQTAHDVIISVKKDVLDGVAGTEEMRGIADHIRRRLSSSNSSGCEGGLGVMDAETLGLPDEIGKLRDIFRARIADRTSKVQRFRVLIAFIEYTCSGLDVLSKRLKDILLKDETNIKSLQTVCGELKDKDAAHIVELLNGISAYVSAEADAATRCAIEVRQLSISHISDIIAYGDKLLTAASNSEELIYKQLCDSARTKSRYHELYLLTANEQTKARERVSSIDHKESEASSASSINKHVSRHIVSMLSALPNGGEHALSMLNVSARASLAQNNLERADEKESKSREVLDSAMKEMNRLCSKYCDNVERLCAQFDKEDDGGWGDLNIVMEHLRSLIITSRENMIATSQVAVSDSAPQLCNDAMNCIVGHYRSENHVLCQDLSYDKPALMRKEVAQASPTLLKILQDLGVSELPEIREEDVFIEEGGMESSETPVEGSNSNDSFLLGGDTGLSQDEEDTFFSVANGSGAEGEAQVAKWMGLPLSGSGMLGMHDTIRDKLNFLKKSRRRYRKAAACGSSTEMFLAYFWPEKSDLQTFPEINTAYFPCSMSETNTMIDLSYGVVFLSDSTFWFSSWTGKRFSLQMGTEIGQLDAVENSWKKGRDFIRILVQKADGKMASLGLGLNGAVRAQQAYDLFQQNVDRAKRKLRASGSDVVKRQCESTLNISGDFVSNEAVGEKSMQLDTILSKMEVVLTRRLNRISVQRFYEIVWEKALYESFLKEGCMDVEVGPWDSTKCQNPFDMEMYDQKRSIRYRLKRKTHLYIGPPIAEIRQTQFCRVEDQEVCVLSMTIEFEGIPYSDCFIVEVRWVAQRDKSDGILVTIGVSVNFRKSTFLKSKIRAAAVEEASAVHRNLFDYVRKACIEAGGTEAPCESDATESSLETIETKSPYAFVKIVAFFFIPWILFRLIHPAPRSQVFLSDSTLMLEHIKNLEDRVDSIQRSLDEILSLIKEPK